MIRFFIATLGGIGVIGFAFFLLRLQVSSYHFRAGREKDAFGGLESTVKDLSSQVPLEEFKEGMKAFSNGQATTSIQETSTTTMSASTTGAIEE